jgi:hypothetical protein
LCPGVPGTHPQVGARSQGDLTASGVNKPACYHLTPQPPNTHLCFPLLLRTPLPHNHSHYTSPLHVPCPWPKTESPNAHLSPPFPPCPPQPLTVSHSHPPRSQIHSFSKGQGRPLFSGAILGTEREASGAGSLRATELRVTELRAMELRATQLIYLLVWGRPDRRMKCFYVGC